MRDEPTWQPVQVRLCDIEPWESNPKRMSKAQAARLDKSSRKLGRAGVLLVGPPQDNGKSPLYDGHQRVKIWQALYGPDAAVNALQSSRPLTDEERRATSLLTVTAQASFDWDLLAGWDFAEISDLGLDADLLAGWNDDAANLRLMMQAENGLPDDDTWADAFGGLPTGDRAPFQQMTFTLHDTQVEQVKAALGASKALGAFVDTGNENSNGNALARICETFLTDYGQG